MTRKPFTKFGSLASSRGALYFANAQDSDSLIPDTGQLIIQTRVDLYKEALKTKGEVVTPKVEAAIESFCRKQSIGVCAVCC